MWRHSPHHTHARGGEISWVFSCPEQLNRQWDHKGPEFRTWSGSGPKCQKWSGIGPELGTRSGFVLECPWYDKYQCDNGQMVKYICYDSSFKVVNVCDQRSFSKGINVSCLIIFDGFLPCLTLFTTLSI